jgi:lysophospholipase L1-like esterase
MISRRLFIGLLPAVLALTVAGCGDSPISPTSTTVVAFGDSITFGVGTTGSNDYVSRLAGRTGVPIENSGRPGDTTAAALGRLEASVLVRNPDIVIVLLGGNDILQGIPVPQRIGNITTIVERIRADGAVVILVGLGSGPIDPFNGALPDLASRTSSTLVPNVLDGILGDAALMADLIHPNDAGHAIIADRIEPALRAALAAVGA